VNAFEDESRPMWAMGRRVASSGTIVVVGFGAKKSTAGLARTATVLVEAHEAGVRPRWMPPRLAVFCVTKLNCPSACGQHAISGHQRQSEAIDETHLRVKVELPIVALHHAADDPIPWLVGAHVECVARVPPAHVDVRGNQCQSVPISADQCRSFAISVNQGQSEAIRAPHLLMLMCVRSELLI